MSNGINHYKQVDIESEVYGASPHRLIQMLFEGALKSVAMAKGAMENGSITQANEHVKKAVTILSGLEEGLDLEKGGEISKNLENLYQHAQDSLFQALADNSCEQLDHVSELLIELKSGWDGIQSAQA